MTQNLEKQIEELIIPKTGRVFTEEDFWGLEEERRLNVLRWLDLKGLATAGFSLISEAIFPQKTYIIIETHLGDEYWTIDEDFPEWS